MHVELRLGVEFLGVHFVPVDVLLHGCRIQVGPQPLLWLVNHLDELAANRKEDLGAHG